MKEDVKLMLTKVIQYSLTITNHQNQQSWLLYVFEFISNIRILSYVFQPIAMQVSGQQASITLLAYIGRPQLLFSSNPDFTYVISLFYILLVIFEVMLIKFLFAKINRRSIEQDLVPDNTLFSIGNTIYKYNLILFHYPLILNIFEFSLLTINQYQIQFQILNIINLIIITTFYIFINYLLSQSILLHNNKYYDVINTNYIDNLIFILSILQILIFRFVISEYLGIIYQSLISIAISVFQLIIVKLFYKHSNQKLLRLKVFINVVIFSVSIETLLHHYFVVNVNQLYFYLIPAVIGILQNQTDFEVMKLFTNQPISLSELRYLTSKYIEFYLQEKYMKSIHKKFMNIQFKLMFGQDRFHDGLIEKILKRYRDIQKNEKQPNINLGAIQLLIECDKLIEAYDLINQTLNKQIQFKYQARSSQDLSFREKNYLQILFAQVRSQINTNTVSKHNGKSSDGEDISTAIQELIHLENTKLGIVQDISQSIKLKVKILSQLLTGEVQSRYLYEETRIVIEFINKVLANLQRRYKQFSTIENQKYLLFFQLEVLNDYQDAFEVSQLNAMEEDTKRSVRSHFISQLTKSMYYAMITEVLDTQHIVITHTTLNINHLFNQNLIGKSITQLIPNFALPYHHKLVKQFFKTGVNKYFQNINNLYLQLVPNINMNINMIMDINQKQTDSIEVIILLKPTENAVPYLILNHNFQIQDLSEALFQTLFQPSIKGLARYFNQIPIQYLIPQIDRTIYDKTQNTYFRVPVARFLQTSTRHSLLETWKNVDQYVEVLCSLIIEEHNIQETIYYKVIFSDFNKAIKDIAPMIFSEDVLIDIPLEENIGQVDYVITNRESLNLVSQTDRQLKQQNQSQNNVDQINRQTHKQQQFEVDDKEQYQVIHRNAQHDFDPLEMGSCMSSVGAFKMSKFYKHFSIIHRFASSVKQNHLFDQFKIVIILYFLMVIIDNLLILQESNKIYSLTNDISLLSIKNDVLEPIENFLVTRYTIINYQQILARSLITQTRYAAYVKFPLSNLGLGYDNAKGSILSILDLPAFQPFLENKYFTVVMPKIPTQGYTANYTFRSVTQQFLNYQYDFKLAYTVKPIDTSGPYFYYSYMNYLVIYDTFDELNDFVLQQSQSQSIILQQNAINMLIPFKILYALVTIWLVILYYQYGKVFIRFQNMFIKLPKDYVKMELRRLQQIDAQITKFNFIAAYYPDVAEKENELISKQEDFNQISNKGFPIQTILIHNFIGYLVVTITVLLPIVLTLVINFSMYNYYTKYLATASFYRQIADLGVDIPTMYAQREVCYYAFAFPYVTPTQIASFKEQIFTCINRTTRFSASLQNFIAGNYLFNTQAIEYLQNMTVQNLCNYLSSDFVKRAGSFCNQTLNEAITKGLSITLTSMINSLTTEYSINQFGTRATFPTLELEGVFLTSQSIQTLLEQMKANIISFTIDLQQNITIICVVCLILQIIMTISILTFYDNYEQKRYTQLKKLIYLFPQCTLLYDQSFHREINSLIVQHQIK